VLMSQAEVGEVAEPVEPGRGGPSNMPHKHNPVACMVAIAASQRVPQRVAALLAVMPQEHERALGAWQAELAEWPQLVISAHGSARALAQALPGLKVDARRMQANLDAVRATLPKGLVDEWFDPHLVRPAAELATTQTNTLRGMLSAALFDVTA
jgi:3-carboxy-cis,cis-muconate cycloisomerase